MGKHESWWVFGGQGNKILVFSSFGHRLCDFLSEISSTGRLQKDQLTSRIFWVRKPKMPALYVAISCPNLWAMLPHGHCAQYQSWIPGWRPRSNQASKNKQASPRLPHTARDGSNLGSLSSPVRFLIFSQSPIWALSLLPSCYSHHLACLPFLFLGLGSLFPATPSRSCHHRLQPILFSSPHQL